jgi:hypothetical protein
MDFGILGKCEQGDGDQQALGQRMPEEIPVEGWL